MTNNITQKQRSQKDLEGFICDMNFLYFSFWISFACLVKSSSAEVAEPEDLRTDEVSGDAVEGGFFHADCSEWSQSIYF